MYFLTLLRLESTNRFLSSLLTADSLIAIWCATTACLIAPPVIFLKSTRAASRSIIMLFIFITCDCFGYFFAGNKKRPGFTPGAS
eukprot:UN26334